LITLFEDGSKSVLQAGAEKMKGHGTKFGRKMEEAVAALLSQRNVEEAAKVVGIATTTLIRWQQLPEFQDAYRKARRNAFSQSVGRLQQASTAAVSTLLKVMVDPSTPPGTRVRAADSVLGHSAKAIEIEDIEARVAELERTQAKRAETPEI
jgi:hypothetical protein